jgi:murein DD-endopeptidase MepM/ murein hydrolase activator NlpD
LPSKDNYTCKGKYILPFEGKWSVVNGGVDKELSHSWVIPSQRYAYDFLIIDNNGKSFSGDPKKVENYYCYGQNIIAPEDGIVVSVCDKWEDSKVYGNGTLDNLIKDICGNSITIKHNESEYSFIAHIMPKSILVNVGQQVKKGEVIAKCGNSGHSTEPHIHFQLNDGKSFYTSAGLPIEFDNIKITENEFYRLYDNRPLPIKNSGSISKELSSKYIRRGQTVENNR